MPQTAVREKVMCLPDDEMDDRWPRKQAEDLTIELSMVTAEKLRLHDLLGSQPAKLSENMSKVSALNRRIARIHERIEWLANHT